jgi:hypothetical protein
MMQGLLIVALLALVCVAAFRPVARTPTSTALPMRFTLKPADPNDMGKESMDSWGVRAV